MLYVFIIANLVSGLVFLAIPFLPIWGNVSITAASFKAFIFCCGVGHLVNVWGLLTQRHELVVVPWSVVTAMVAVWALVKALKENSVFMVVRRG